jgi:hypothetical protein
MGFFNFFLVKREGIWVWKGERAWWGREEVGISVKMKTGLSADVTGNEGSRGFWLETQFRGPRLVRLHCTPLSSSIALLPSIRKGLIC